LKTLVTSLRTAQVNFGWNYGGSNRGLFPWFEWDSNGNLKVVSNPTIGLGDNANLAQSLAVMIGALEGGTFSGQEATDVNSIISTATTILNSMKTGFEAFYDAGVGLFRHDYDGSFNGHVDRLTNEFRATVAFLVSFYGISRNAWDNLILNPAAHRTYKDSQGRDIPVIVPYQGAAFQMFWPMLRTNEQEYVEVQAMLKNFLYAAADYAARNKIPGFPSAGYVPNRNDYSGTLGIAELSETQVNNGYTTATVGNIYSLASAFTLDPNFVIDWLYEIEHQNPNFIRGAYGYYDSIVSNTEIGKAHYAIDQATLVLALANHGGNDFDCFMQNRAKYANFRGLYRDLNTQLAMTPHANAAPPVFPTETFTVFNRFQTESGTGFMTGGTQEYGIRFNYSGKSGTASHTWELSSTLYGSATTFNARNKKVRLSYSIANSPGNLSVVLKSSSGAVIGTLPVTLDTSAGIHTIDLLVPDLAAYENVAQIALEVNAASDGTADFYIHSLQFRNA